MDSEQRVNINQTVVTHEIGRQFSDAELASDLMALSLGIHADMIGGRFDDDDQRHEDAMRHEKVLYRAAEHFRARVKLEGAKNPILGPRVHPDAGVDMRYTLVESGVAELVRIFEQVAPAGRELSVALTHLETAGLWALAAVARDPSSSGTG